MTDSNQNSESEDVSINTAVIKANRRHRDAARTARRSGDLEVAGAHYVAAARGGLMRSRRLPEETDAADGLSVRPAFGLAVRELFAGALCFRLADTERRCEYHCEQGIAIAADAREEFYTYPAEVGLSHEMIGDFRLLADRDDYDDAYAAAAERYAPVENNLGWQMEDGFDDLSRFLLVLAASVGMAPDDDLRNTIARTSLDERIAYKREHYPEIIDAVVEAGNWESSNPWR